MRIEHYRHAKRQAPQAAEENPGEHLSYKEDKRTHSAFVRLLSKYREDDEIQAIWHLAPGAERITTITTDNQNLTTTILRVLANHELLAPEQEILYAKQIKAGLEPNAPEDVQRTAAIAAHELMRHNGRLVISIAKHYRGRGVPLMDLLQEGRLGLMKATEKFDGERGFRFSTYASWWILQTITRAIQDEANPARIPIHVGELMNRVNKCSRLFEQKHGRLPTASEIATELDEDSDKIERLLKEIELIRQTIRLDKPVNETSKETYGEVLAADSYDLQEDGNDGVLSEAIEKILTEFTPREAEIIRLRFGLSGVGDHTLVQVSELIERDPKYNKGEKKGLSRERIRQIEKNALRKLKTTHPELRDFLS